MNNGSTDNTKSQILNIIKKNNRKNILIKLVDLKNKGYGGGIYEGLKLASGKYIGWSHADLQTPLSDYYKIYKLIKNQKGYSVRDLEK